MACAPEDMPQMWERPDSTAILAALKELEVRPPTWSHKRRRSDIIEEQQSLASQRKGEATRYLSSIIKSPLAWLESDEEREAIWDTASKRMSERCGRAAMGEVTRRWPFAGTGTGTGAEPFELTIREPALTGDSLGLKTWGSSYALARHLPALARTSLFRLFDETLGRAAPRVLELGSGTGLLGLAAAALWGVPVALSDLGGGVVENLKGNAERNAHVVGDRGGEVRVGMLRWGSEDEEEVDVEMFGRPFQFNIILAADSIYDDNHPTLLASAISTHLSLDSDARAVVMVPRRDEITHGLIEAFKRAMLDLDLPMFCDEEDELAGQDDWDDGGEDVRCWLGVFSRRGSPAVVEEL